MMHKHVWEVESKVTQPSGWEMMNEGALVTTLEHAHLDLFVKPVIVTYKCAICGGQKVERV